jgi:hypothetical protein
MRSRLLALVLVGVIRGVLGCTSAPSDGPSLQELPEGVTRWAPQGPRTAGSYGYDVIPEPDSFHTMHVGPNNGDNVWVAVAPELELNWVVETSFYIPEGPTFDNQGNLYFSPLFPQENVSLVSLDAETGERNWAIEGDGINAGSGAILILNDPEDAAAQVIYHATYTEAMALLPDGTEIWRTPTGLTLPPVVPGERSTAHSFGLNYHPRTDSVVGVTIGGAIFAFDRVTGRAIAPVGQVPGAPATSVVIDLPQLVIDQSNALTDEVFGKTPGGLSLFSVIIDVIFGGGSVVTNYFAIDPNTSVIYVAATAEDAADGNEDGQSDLGALYAIDLVDDTTGGLVFQVQGVATFDGGTGSTPSVSEDGNRIYVSDNAGNLIALDRDLEERWRFDVGDPLAASVAVSPDNDELYAVTRKDVFKLTDQGDNARLDWTATLDAFSGDPDIEVEFQALTPTIAANGVAISVGGGKPVGERELMLKVGVGLLDRHTGRLRSFALGREESIAVTSVASDGGVYTASSPVRRVSGKAIYPDLTEDIIGGISRYKPIRNDRLALEASCAAAVRARNAATIADSAPQSAAQDIRQLQVLIDQSRAAITRALAADDLSEPLADTAQVALDASEASLSLRELAAAADHLFAVCNGLEE